MALKLNLKKDELITIAEELGLIIPENAKIVDLKRLIESSDEFKNDIEFLRDLIENVLEEKRERLEKAKRESEQEIELEKLKLAQLEKQLEIANIRGNLVDTSKTTVTSETDCDNLENLIKSVRTLTIRVPSKSEGWGFFFTSLERAFNTKNISEKYKAEILLNLLEEKASNILTYITEKDLNNYEVIKSIVLREFEPTAQAVLENFRRASRENETHIQFASRLTTSFDYYLNLRGVKDFETLKQLIVSDKLFRTLDRDTASHINVRQGEKWFKPLELAKECDLYFTSRGKIITEKRTELRAYNNNHNSNGNHKYVPPPFRNSPFTRENKYFPYTRECYICSSNSHMAKSCPNRRNKYYEQSNKASNDIQNKTRSNTQTSINKSSDNTAVVTNVNSKHLQSSKTLNEINLYPLQKVSISIASRQIDAIIDSGAEISILNTTLLPSLEIEAKGKIILQSAFKEQVEAKLAILPVYYKNPDDCLFYSSNILFALTDKLNIPCLITPDAYNSLIYQNDDSAKIENTLVLECDTSVDEGEEMNKSSSRDGRHEPDPEKLLAIEIIETPKTKSALKSALGLFNYYRNYIKNYAEIAKPLTDLTKKKVPELIPWTDIEELSFQKLKKKLSEAPSLYTPDPKKPYVIQCDASSYGVGACLSQRDDNGQLCPISFASQKLNKVQQNWATIEREAYAVVWSIKKFENYVFGANIDIITDHNPLIFLQKSAPQSAKLQRWALALQRYNIHITHCPGAQLKNADGLSRLVSD
nr:uncharacterized protein LOC122271326 [Parasteatoda tepidariorum]